MKFAYTETHVLKTDWDSFRDIYMLIFNISYSSFSSGADHDKFYEFICSLVKLNRIEYTKDITIFPGDIVVINSTTKEFLHVIKR